jgi:hypothetical protein
VDALIFGVIASSALVIGALVGARIQLPKAVLAAMLAFAVVALDLVWPLWLAVLVVMVVVFAAAGIAALLGKKQLAKAGSLVPQDTIASVETDVQTVKNAAQRGRHA